MSGRQIPADDIKQEVSFALWDLQLGAEPESVVRRLLYRLFLMSEGAKMTSTKCCNREHPQGVEFDTCERRDLLSQAFLTGRIHAQRGSRCLTNRARELFGDEAAEKYEQGYRYEVESWS